jgi:hypothetical protein
MPNTITDPKKQLELLAAHQQEFERFLCELTGLTVKVSLSVHATCNTADHLLQLFEASFSTPDFKQVITSGRTWIAHEELGRNISIFMPKGFDADELYPEPEDDEGYEQAIETANAEHSAAHTDTQEDDIPF